jgi:hypothetical protein
MLGAELPQRLRNILYSEIAHAALLVVRAAMMMGICVKIALSHLKHFDQAAPAPSL